MAQKAVQKASTQTIPEFLRITGRSKPLAILVSNAVGEGSLLTRPDGDERGEIEDSSAIDLSLSTEAALTPPPAPSPGTSYAGLTPAQRHTFLVWCRNPEASAPLAFQQLYLANLEARLLEEHHREPAIQQLAYLGTVPAWSANGSLHRAFLFASWLLQDGQRLTEWTSTRSLPADLMGIALGLQAMLDAPLTAQEIGNVISIWHLGSRLPADLLKLRLDSLTSILGQQPLAYGLARLDPSLTAPRPWRTSHRGLRLMMPQPDLRPHLEPALRDLLTVSDLDEDANTPAGLLATPTADAAAEATPETVQPSLEELGWRLILEFGSNRSEYFDYVLIQCQKLAGYSQLMDEDRRMVYRTIFRKSEMRRFWRIWDYVHGWTSTRVYLNGEELEKWKVWPYSQYLR